MTKENVFLIFTALLLFATADFALAQEVSVEKKTPAPSKETEKEMTPERERTAYFWQPLKGFSGLEFTAQNNWISYNTVVSGVAESVAINSPVGTLTYSYGLTDLWAVSLEFMTTLAQIQTTVNGSTFPTSLGGPNDLGLIFKNTTPEGLRWNLHYGVKFNFSFDVSQPPGVGSSQGNNYSGGDGVSPYVGTSYNFSGTSFVGLQALYDYRGTRTVDPGENIQGAWQNTGGNQALGTAFIEWHTYPWLFHLNGVWIWYSAQQTTSTISNSDDNPYEAFLESLGIEYFLNKQTFVAIGGALQQVGGTSGAFTAVFAHGSETVDATFRVEF